MAELSPFTLQSLSLVRQMTRGVCAQRPGVPMSATMSYNIQREAAETKEFGVFLYLASDAAYTT